MFWFSTVECTLHLQSNVRYIISLISPMLKLPVIFVPNFHVIVFYSWVWRQFFAALSLWSLRGQSYLYNMVFPVIYVTTRHSLCISSLISSWTILPAQHGVPCHFHVTLCVLVFYSRFSWQSLAIISLISPWIILPVQYGVPCHLLDSAVCMLLSLSFSTFSSWPLHCLSGA